MGSVRDYAVLFVGGKRRGTSSSIGGGNVLLNVGQHELGGPEHTGQLPIERISTDELDTSLVIAPDGLGGLAARAEASPMVPYHIGSSSTFVVPIDLQALFSVPITIDAGGSLVVAGYLVEVH